MFSHLGFGLSPRSRPSAASPVDKETYKQEEEKRSGRGGGRGGGGGGGGHERRSAFH